MFPSYCSNFGVERSRMNYATPRGILTETSDNDIAIVLEIPVREEKEGVIRLLVDNLKVVTTLLEALPLQTSQTAMQVGDDEITS